MRTKLFKLLPLLLAIFLLSAHISRGTGEEGKEEETTNPNLREQALIKTIMKKLNYSHFQPQAINDDFSGKAFDLYLKRLDYNKRFLTATDVEAFGAYRTQLDDEVKNSNYTFFELTATTIDKRVKESQTYYKEILAKPFDFSTEESIELERDNMDYAKDEAALKERWRKSLKYATLRRVTDMVEKQEKAQNGDKEESTSFKQKEEEDEEEEVEIKTLVEMEVEAREKVLKNQERWFKRMEGIDRNDRLSAYLNSIINIYGPHTGYFPPKDKEDFDISMSGRLEGIGARLVEKDGYIKVSEIVPGSASAQQGELKAEDLILKVAQGKDEPIDVVEMPLDEAVKLIRGKKGSEVRLTVKKIDGTTTVIPIIRDVVLIEETYAKSAVIHHAEVSKKLGYIKLPKFYADFSRSGGRSCSRDMALELQKLNQEGVDGIILDLRNNGGGSLNDAVDMAGLFIDEGPIVQVKSRSGAPYVLADKAKGTLYDGPLVILVNTFSASASEILAAAMQDYNRAIVIGSETSFGKGTVQRFFDMDQNLSREYADAKPLGAIKITTQKFYRVDGGATQLKGVIPDIILPDAFRYIETGEKEHEYVMQWDEIDPAPYSPWKPSFNAEAVREKSEARTASNEVFQLIDENAHRLKEQSDMSLYSLNMEKFREEREAREKISEKYEDIEKENGAIQANNLQPDLERINQSDAKVKTNEKWLESLRKDSYINEAAFVLKDMMK